MRKAVSIVPAVTQLILECSLPSSLGDGKLLHLHQEIGIYLCMRIFDYNHVRILRFERNIRAPCWIAPLILSQ